MLHKKRFTVLPVSILIRLSLILFLLLAMAPVTGAAPGGGGRGKGRGGGGPAQLGPVELKGPASQKRGRPHNIKVGSLVAPELRGIHATDPIDMKVLVISADGAEPGFPAIKASLSQIGVPYDTLIALQTPLVSSMLWDGGVHGYYQGVILVTGDLAYYDAATGLWPSAFDDAEWARLWEYESMFGIRQVTAYTYPGGAPDSYGLAWAETVDTTSKPLQATLTTAGKQIFSDLNTATPVTFNGAWVYLSTVVSPTMVTPLLTTAQNYTVASIIQYPDGRQNLTITADNNPYLLHSLLLSYGAINWVTKGLFLGERHVNLGVQVDDLLIEDDLWDTAAFTDTTGLVYRITGADYNALVKWQNSVRAKSQFSQFRLEMAYNGEGSEAGYWPNDTLTPAVKSGQANFNWVNHTYSHVNLDAISYTLALSELTQDHNVATTRLKLSKYYKDALVQPDISGLYNPEFQRAAKDYGIRYLIADTSRTGWDNPSPNAGFAAMYEPDILVIPRRPTNLFYNLTTPAEWVSEYNCYYGPNGACAGGAWRWWDHDLTYAEILDSESDVWLQYLLKWDLDPLMFHQANLRAYNKTNSLLGELVNAVVTKYLKVSKLPIRNLSQHEAGLRMAARMAYNASGVKASLVPCSAGVSNRTLTLVSPTTVQVPVTGVAYGTNKETYGNQTISYVQLQADQPVVVTVPGCQ